MQRYNISMQRYQIFIRELKIDDAATPRRGVNIYGKKKDFWNLMSVTIAFETCLSNLLTVLFAETMRCQL